MACLFGFGSLSFAQQSKSSAITPDFVAAAFDAAASRARTLEIEFDKYLGLNSFDQNLAEQRPYYVVTLLRAGERISIDTRLWKSQKNSWRHTIQKYDGKVQKVHFPEEGTGIIRGIPPTDDDIGPNPVPWQSVIWGRNLADRVSADELTILPEQVSVDGKPCYVVTGRDAAVPDILHYTLWLDPDIDFMPRRIEEITAGDPSGTTSRRTFREYEEVEENVWIARRIDALGIDPATGDIRTRNVTLVKTVAVNHSLSAKSFQIDFPVGTFIEDEIMATSYGIASHPTDEISDMLELPSDPADLDETGTDSAPSKDPAAHPTPANEEPATAFFSNTMLIGTITAAMALTIAVCGAWIVQRKNNRQGRSYPAGK